MIILKGADLSGGFIGVMVASGNYTVTLSKRVDGNSTDLSEPVSFSLERMYEGALPTADPSKPPPGGRRQNGLTSLLLLPHASWIKYKKSNSITEGFNPDQIGC